jgi:hypothetical protein
MNRFVEDLPAFTINDSRVLTQIGQGVTHYQASWIDTFNGDAIRADLMAAGVGGDLGDYVQVSYDPEADVLDVALLLDDGGHWSSTIESVLAAHTTG